MLIYVISVIVALLVAFLCGSIPVALMVGKSLRGLDVREHGSGNAGSTNAVRVLGIGPGLLVFAGDVLKGALGCAIVSVTVGLSLTIASTEATQQAFSALSSASASEAYELDPLISILASGRAQFLYDIPRALAIIVAVLGHMFSPFMGFKGGKGVATTLGAVIVALPLTAACALAVFLVIVLISRFVSLGSIIAVITVPVFTYFFYPSPTFLVLTALLAVMVVWAHRKNIVRLAKGEEPKFSLPKKGRSAAGDSGVAAEKDEEPIPGDDSGESTAKDTVASSSAKGTAKDTKNDSAEDFADDIELG